MANQEPHSNLKSLLAEALELRNVNHAKLAELTGISERYIWAIQNIEVEKLPPAPYVRGYLKKIAEVLHLNHDEIWDLYSKELAHRTSGKYDTLPENRFAIHHLSRKQIFTAGIGFLFTLYLLTNATRLIGKPDLRITFPESPTFATIENRIMITGTVSQRDKLTVNDQEIFVSQDNTFTYEYDLQPGLNVFQFRAKRFLGSETVVEKTILYQPLAELPGSARP